MQEKWNKVYSETPMFAEMWYPSDGIIKLVARYLQRRIGIDSYSKKREVGRVLDAGCGNGRYMAFFAEQGFEAYGVDLSGRAIEVARAWVKERGVKAHLEIGDISSLPFEDGYFDVVVSDGVLDHIPLSEAKKIMREFGRVLAKNGYVFITLRSTEDSGFEPNGRMPSNTQILQGGYEKGFLQHFFDLGEIKELFGGFKVFDIELHEERFPDLFTVDKAFIQSFKGERKYIDFSKPVELNLKYARWYIAAEKEVSQ